MSEVGGRCNKHGGPMSQRENTKYLNIEKGRK